MLTIDTIPLHLLTMGNLQQALCYLIAASLFGFFVIQVLAAFVAELFKL